MYILDSFREYFICYMSGIRTGKVILLLVEAVGKCTFALEKSHCKQALTCGYILTGLSVYLPYHCYKH